MASGVYLHFLCLFLYCHVTLLCSLCQTVMVSCLRCKNLWISMTTSIVFLFNLGNLPCHLFAHRCTLLWFFNDVKSIVLSFRPYPTIHPPLVSSSGSLSLTFNDGLVPNLCIGNREQGFNISHFSINIFFNII